MDRAVKFCFVSFVLLAMMTSQVGATNTQGFYWGLKSGDRLDYSYEVYNNLTFSAVSLNERLYIIVNGLPVLPDTVTKPDEVTCRNVTAYWANGSLMGGGNLMIGSPTTMFFAVGNWPLLAYLFSAGSTPDYEIVDDTSVWGIRAGRLIGSNQYNTSWTFSKSDGATIQYYSILHDTTTDTELFHAELNRVVVEGVSTPVLVSAAIISGEIIVAVLLVRRYRH